MDCPTQWVERDGYRRSEARFDDRCVLRLRDVRTDDGVHRPREMRRSCRRKAVGSSGDPDSPYLATDAFCSDDTTKQPNTHNTESREVLYPWHAWHGRSVWIHQAMVKNGVAIFHCGLEQAALRLLQVPQWMFDRTICRGMHLASAPAISINAMLELKRLLASATLGGHNVTIDSGHRQLESTRGANAKRTENSTIATVPSATTKGSSVGDIAVRAATPDRAAFGAIAVRTPRKKSYRKPRKGGVR
jgi:hypothetical protein